jgi:alpha-D-ribose 1-methylphosphonate 5-triphosphate synthase subunit PhnI
LAKEHHDFEREKMKFKFCLAFLLTFEIICAQNCCRFRTTTEPMTTTTAAAAIAESSTESLLNATKIEELNKICGRRTPQQFASSLVLGGQEVARGDFSWLTALYHATKRFLCGNQNTFKVQF